MTTEMTREIFLRNLRRAAEEVCAGRDIRPDRCVFRLNPVIEEGKSLQAKDEIMRLRVINPDRVGGKSYTADEVASMLAFFAPLVPIWIDVRLERFDGGQAELVLDCSLRLRKPSLLRNRESGHPPFRAIV